MISTMKLSHSKLIFWISDRAANCLFKGRRTWMFIRQMKLNVWCKIKSGINIRICLPISLLALLITFKQNCDFKWLISNNFRFFFSFSNAVKINDDCYFWPVNRKWLNKFEGNTRRFLLQFCFFSSSR